ncbi:gastrula zinc finger protein XlCGF57.1-like isoform X1 [Tachysurus ichikawai]
MSRYELFQSQTVSIMTLLADTARAGIYRVYYDNTDTQKELKLTQLNAIVEFLVKEAVRKICLLYKLCSVEKDCNAVDLASLTERSGNAQSLPELMESSIQPEYSQTTISGGAVYLLVTGEKLSASTPQQDVIKDHECRATSELESATAISSSVKMEEIGKKQTILIMKGSVAQIQTQVCILSKNMS